MFDKIAFWFARSDEIVAFKAVRRGLMHTIPVLVVGAFCSIILNLPSPPYQEFISSVPFFLPFFQTLYKATLGLFSLYASAIISISYSQAHMEKHGDFFIQGAPFAALGAFLLLEGFGSNGFSSADLGTGSLAVAVLRSLAASAVYCAFVNRPKRRLRVFNNATDNVLSRAVASILPIALVVIVAAVLNMAVSLAFGVPNVEGLISLGVDSLFPADISTLGNGALYLFLNNLMCFFGVHGPSMLDGVSSIAFVPGDQGGALVAAGAQAGQIITKPFLDVFASIGGAGALLSLLLAVLVFGRKRNMRDLAGISFVPMAFNVSEPMLFGLPVIWNPVLLIPFLAVPLVNLLLAYAATQTGLVPPMTADVSWITPPLLGGYLATGSWAGAALQAFCLVVGMFVYLPFMRLQERGFQRVERNEFERLVGKFRQYEVERNGRVLTAMPTSYGFLVRTLAFDLHRAVVVGAFDLFYQPQFDAMNRVVGVEGLLRWNHPTHGMMYPPLVVKLAEETGMLERLEEAVVTRALDDALRMQRLANAGVLPDNFSVNVNVTAKSLQDKVFVDKVIEGFKERRLDPGRFVLEAPERDVILMNDDFSYLLARLIDVGVSLSIDNFSMSNISFKYLETSSFSMVKLDGRRAAGLVVNPLYGDIASSVRRLSEQLYFKVFAEYVEAPGQHDQLQRLGCLYFQGFLYAPAVPFEEMLNLVQAYMSHHVS